MSRFDDIKLGWNGRDYKIPANRVLGAIMRIEDITTLQELALCARREQVPLGKVASAYGAVLRYAGADVEDDDVYAGMFSDAGTQLSAVQAVVGLLNMMIPKGAMAQAEAGGHPPGNGAAASARRSSKKHTKQ